MVVCYQFGPTNIAKLSNPHELRNLLIDPWLNSETVIVKPNLVASAPGIPTHPEALRALFESLETKIIVTESHIVCRSNKLKKVSDWSTVEAQEDMYINVKGKKMNYIWLMMDEGWRWQLKNPDYSWFKDGGQWNQIKKEEKEFLDTNGYTDLFEEFDVEYINVTDEVWSGRVADPEKVKQMVKSRYGSLHIEKLYGLLPKKLYDLRGSTLVSFAKMQTYNSFTIKNLFGLIPDPVRAWWHGPGDKRLPHSIIDVNKVYRSLFNVYGVIETLFENPVVDPVGEFLDPMGTKYHVVENIGVVAFGRNPVSLDAIFCNLAGFNMSQYGDYLRKSENVFGGYDRETLIDSKEKVGSWLSG